MRVHLPLATALAFAGCGGPRSAADAAGDPDDAPADDAQPLDAAPPPTVAVISTTHRYVPGLMFGGWGPHLGHLVRLPSGRLTWVDDGCDLGGGAGGCDVNVDRRLEYHEQVEGAWQLRTTLALPTGIQQNTGTIVDSKTLASFGVDTATSRLVECRMDPDTWLGSCAPIIDAALPASTNYVGAAISPDGYPMTWATTVADGGGGQFHWWVDYGGGWNGPRTGGVGGYNDASYINIGFGAASAFVLHAELVAGLAPTWTFHAAVADGDAATANAVAFALLPAGAAPLISTNDVIVDPETGDTHVLARTAAGEVSYLHRAAGAGFAAAVAIPGAYFRARWIHLADGRLVLVHARAGAGLAYRVFAAGRASGPLDVAGASEIAVALPEGYADLVAIYPETSVYQRTLPTTLSVAVVGTTRQHEVLHVEVPAP